LLTAKKKERTERESSLGIALSKPFHRPKGKWQKKKIADPSCIQRTPDRHLSAVGTPAGMPWQARQRTHESITDSLDRHKLIYQ